MATKVNLHIDQGSVYKHVFTWVNQCTEEAIDLTNYTVRCQMRPHIFSDVLLFDGDNDQKGNLEITDAANGEVTLTVPSATSDAWVEYEEAVYDIEVVNPSSVPERIAEGKVFIHKQVTR